MLLKTSCDLQLLLLGEENGLMALLRDVLASTLLLKSKRHIAPLLQGRSRLRLARQPVLALKLVTHWASHNQLVLSLILFPDAP
jgi:hypothetical protein